MFYFGEKYINKKIKWVNSGSGFIELLWDYMSYAYRDIEYFRIYPEKSSDSENIGILRQVQEESWDFVLAQYTIVPILNFFK